MCRACVERRRIGQGGPRKCERRGWLVPGEYKWGHIMAAGRMAGQKYVTAEETLDEMSKARYEYLCLSEFGSSKP